MQRFDLSHASIKAMKIIMNTYKLFFITFFFLQNFYVLFAGIGEKEHGVPGPLAGQVKEVADQPEIIYKNRT